MKLNVALSQPVGATLVLLGILALGGLALAGASADLAAAVDERDAKAGFVSRGLAARSPSAAQASGSDHLAVVADSDTLAAAQMDALVRTTVADAGGSVLSSRAEAKHDETGGAAGPTERIEVQAVVQGRIEALQASLYRLENGTPMVLVDALAVRSAEATEEGAGQAAPVLTATLTLSAFWDRPKP